jgi:Spy/CpxP family protein refolding chaperone
MERSARTRLFTVVVLAVVFGAGIVLGVAIGHRDAGIKVATAAADSTAHTQNADSAGRRHRQPMYMQVNPTPEQKAKLDSILKVYRDSMQVLTHQFHQDYDPHYDSLQASMDSLRTTYHKKYDPRMQAIFAEARAAIRAVLTPEQETKYDSILAKAHHDDSLRIQADRNRRRGDRGGDRNGGRDGGREGRD